MIYKISIKIGVEGVRQSILPFQGKIKIKLNFSHENVLKISEKLAFFQKSAFL